MTETALPSELSSKELIFCNQCKTKTNHICQAEYLRSRGSFETEWEETWYRLWVCAGCEEATLEIRYINSGYRGPEYYDSTFFPKRAPGDLSQKHFWQLNKKLASIYREVIESFNAGLRILCAVGLRALLEGICAEKRIRGYNLEKKINQLDEYLPSDIVESLHSFRFMGNEAAHELQAPEYSELRLAIEVMEDLLNFLYEFDYKARRLTQKR